LPHPPTELPSSLLRHACLPWPPSPAFHAPSCLGGYRTPTTRYLVPSLSHLALPFLFFLRPWACSLIAPSPVSVVPRGATPFGVRWLGRRLPVPHVALLFPARRLRSAECRPMFSFPCRTLALFPFVGALPPYAAPRTCPSPPYTQAPQSRLCYCSTCFLPLAFYLLLCRPSLDLSAFSLSLFVAPSLSLRAVSFPTRDHAFGRTFHPAFFYCLVPALFFRSDSP